MIIVEKPYASELLIDSIAQNDWPVLDNAAIEDANIEKGAFYIIPSENAKKYFINQEYPLIYANSENAIDWVLENLPKSNLSGYIKLFKDKILFREKLKEIYPDFYFESVEFDAIKNISPDKIKFPVVIKPAIGFLSFGVHTVMDAKEWKDVVSKLEKEMKNATSLYPETVINSSKFIIEELIDGEEFAIDTYYDRDGEPVILNIFQHPFLNNKDVSDRIYMMSIGIMIKYMAKFSVLLRDLGKIGNMHNFPMHIEVRVTRDGRIIPIEVNPMRFAGWCTTDVAKYAWGINVYECFFNQIKPDWNKILGEAKKGVYYFSMAEVPLELDRAKIKGFDYEKCLANYSDILEVRRVNFKSNPLFAIVFGHTNDKNEIINILSFKTKDYVIS